MPTKTKTQPETMPEYLIDLRLKERARGARDERARTQVHKKLPAKKQTNFFANVKWGRAHRSEYLECITGSYNGLGVLLSGPLEGKLAGKWYGSVTVSNKTGRECLTPNDTLIRTPNFGTRRAAINNLKAQFNVLVSAVTGY